MTPQKKQLLIDGDILIYSFSCGNEVTFDWGEGVVTYALDLEMAKEEIKVFVRELQVATDTEEMEPLICFSCPKEENFRYKILPTYKHTRQGKEKPTLYYDLKAWVEENYQTKQKPTLEADDVLGILSTRNPGQYVIATKDKDLKQIPGALYNWGTEDYTEIDQEEADLWFYTQVLTGDTCDGYSGCPRVGKVKAERILKEAFEYYLDNPFHTKEECIWKYIVEAYQEKGLTEEDALTQARVARILRAGDYDFNKTKGVILWTPCKEISRR